MRLLTCLSSTYSQPMTSIFSSFSTSSLPVIVTSVSLTSPTQVLQFKNIIDIKLILVTIVPCIIIIVIVLIIAIISVVVVNLVLRSSQRRYEITTMKDKTAMENPYIISRHWAILWNYIFDIIMYFSVFYFLFAL